MKAALLCLVALAAHVWAKDDDSLSPPLTDLLNAPPVMTSPGGTYSLQKRPAPDADVILVRNLPAPSVVKGIDPIKDWMVNYPCYKVVWSDHADRLALVRLTFRRSDLAVYVLEGNKAVPVMLPDFDDLLDSKERARIPKADLPTLNQRQRHFSACKFEDSTTLLLTIYTYYVSDIEQIFRTNLLKLHIKNGKAKVVSHTVMNY